jgi:hypothetical protein
MVKMRLRTAYVVAQYRAIRLPLLFWLVIFVVEVGEVGDAQIDRTYQKGGNRGISPPPDEERGEDEVGDGDEEREALVWRLHFGTPNSVSGIVYRASATGLDMMPSWISKSLMDLVILMRMNGTPSMVPTTFPREFWSKTGRLRSRRREILMGESSHTWIKLSMCDP